MGTIGRVLRHPAFEVVLCLLMLLALAAHVAAR